MSDFNSDKPRKRRPSGETKELKKSFVIYCEGQSEVEYFNYLKKEKRLTNLNIKIIELKENGNALTLVKEAIQKKNIESSVDEFWIAIDKDDTKENEFEDAIKLSQDNKINPAYSIQCFEVWILYHFQELNDKCERKQLKEKINSHLKNCNYGKTKEEIQKVIKEILPKLEIAIKHAKLSFDKFEKHNISISNRESSSTIFQLIEKLLK
jgi:hypothetical protein